MTEPGIRPKVVCVFRRGDEILVGSHYDRVKEERFYGPPGGGIEFQEYAADALRRGTFTAAFRGPPGSTQP